MRVGAGLRGALQPLRLAYAWYATGDAAPAVGPIVALHGLLGSKGNWNSLCKAMHRRAQPHRQAFALDARNHGDSPHSPQHTYAHMAADLGFFMDEHALGPACLVGHSMGGRTGMTFALQHPERVEKLVVVDMSPISTSRDLSQMWLIFDTLKKISVEPSLSLVEGKQAVDRQLAETFSNPALRSFLLTNLIKHDKGGFGWRTNVETLAQAFGPHIANYQPPEGRVYDRPTLFIAGENSDFLQKVDEDGILEIFPQAQFEYVANAGHNVHSDQPAVFLDLVMNFINQD